MVSIGLGPKGKEFYYPPMSRSGELDAKHVDVFLTENLTTESVTSLTDSTPSDASSERLINVATSSPSKDYAPSLSNETAANSDLKGVDKFSIVSLSPGSDGVELQQVSSSTSQDDDEDVIMIAKDEVMSCSLCLFLCASLVLEEGFAF